MVNLRFLPSILSSKVNCFRRCGGRGPTPLAKSFVPFLQRLKSSSVEEIMACLPFYTQGEIVKGFGRGSKELGIPTGRFMIKETQQNYNAAVSNILMRLKSITVSEYIRLRVL